MDGAFVADGASRQAGGAFIRIEDLGFAYPSEGGDVAALDGVTLSLAHGSFTSVIGRNGSGKSTLAKCVNALLVPTQGVVFVGGRDTRSEETLWDVRRMAGMVFQNPDNQLVSAVVEDDVAFGPENLGLPREEIKARVKEALESVDMYECRKMAPHLLSGGQKQRVAIAGVVAMKPDAVILDEPTAMLDPEGRGEVMGIAKRLHESGVTVALITHFMDETLDSDRIVIMDGGRVVMDGAPADVFRRTDAIRALGLRLPFAVEVAELLRGKGIPVPEAVMREGELADAIAAHAPAREGGGDVLSHAARVGTGMHAPALSGSGGDGMPGATRKSAGMPDGAQSQVDAKEPIIVVRNLTHTYNKGLAYETTAADDVSFEVQAGEFVSIVGHTGSGKSTLVQHLNGLLRPTSGTVRVAGVDVTGKGTPVIEVRKKIGMVFQYPEHQLFEETVYKDVAFGPRNLGLADAEVDARVREALALMDVDFDNMQGRSPFELSGGQKRRVAVAGVLAMRPEVLVLDEPTAGLDPRAHDDMLDSMVGIQAKTGCTIVLVSHDMEDVARLSDRVFVMSKGRIALSGAPDDVFFDEAFLAGIGLALPPARAFANMLMRRGLPLPPKGLLTRAALADAVGGLCGGLGDGVAHHIDNVNIINNGGLPQ